MLSRVQRTRYGTHLPVIQLTLEDRYDGNFLLPEYVGSPGNFRQGQLVKISVTIRSRLRQGKSGNWRCLHLGLKRIILINRDTEMVSMSY